jgi:hypothetical protein
VAVDDRDVNVREPAAAAAAAATATPLGLGRGLRLGLSRHLQRINIGNIDLVTEGILGVHVAELRNGEGSGDDKEDAKEDANCLREEHEA